MDWRLQIVKKAIMARIPFGAALRRQKRRLFGYTLDPRNLRYTLDNLEVMKAELHAAGRSFSSATVLEIGSGWFPTIPVMLAIESAKHVYMTDLTPNMDSVTFKSTIAFLKDAFPSEQRLKNVSSSDDLPLSYLAPFLVPDIPDKSIDYVISRTVLEHIPPDDIVDFLASLRPKLVDDGLMIHLVDNSDHLEFADKSISRINFLSWSQRQHALFNWLMKDGENRLRHHEYPPLFEKAGFKVVRELTSVDQPTLQRAKTLPLTTPYSTMCQDQLAALTSVFLLAKS